MHIITQSKKHEREYFPGGILPLKLFKFVNFPYIYSRFKSLTSGVAIMVHSITCTQDISLATPLVSDLKLEYI